MLTDAELNSIDGFLRGCGSETALFAFRQVRNERDNLNLLRVQLSNDSQMHLDRALAAEAENAALRERAEKYEAIAVAQTEAYRKAEADNAALRNGLDQLRDACVRGSSHKLGDRIMQMIDAMLAGKEEK